MSLNSRSGLKSEVGIGVLFALGFLLIQLPFRYPGLVEADSVRVSYGIAHAIRSGEGLAARDMYGRTFSFGYYWLFITIYPLIFKSFAPLVGCMNGLNLICVSASFLPLYLWMNLLWGRAVAVAATALLAATPVVFELGGAGHPEGPAFLALNTALALFLHAQRPEARRRGVKVALAAAIAFLAAILRADVLLGFPLFPLLAPLAAGHAHRRRGLAAGALVAFVAATGFFAAQAAVVAAVPPRVTPIPGGTFTGKLGILTFLAEYWAIAKQVRSLSKGIAVWATGLGPLLLAMGLLGTIAALRRHRRFAWAAVAVLVVNGGFWLPDPTPSRHLLMTFLVLVPAAVLWVRDHVPPARFAAAVAVVLALNLASMAAAYPVVVRSYPFRYVSLLPRRVNTWVPMGDPISNRIWTRRQVRLETVEARQMAASGEPRLLVLGSFVTVRLLYEIYAFSPAYEISYVWRHGAFLAHAVTPETEYLIYDYAAEPTQITPREFVERIAAAADLKDFAIAIVPSDQPVEGAAEVPPGYRAFEFDLREAGINGR